MPAPTTTLDLTLKLQPTSQVTGQDPESRRHAGRRGRDRQIQVGRVQDVLRRKSSIGEMSCTTIPQGIQEAMAVTDATGTFLFAVVNAGNYTLTAFENADFTGRTARLRGSVRAGEKADVLDQAAGHRRPDREGVRQRCAHADSWRQVQVKQIDYPNRERGALQRPERRRASVWRGSPAATRSAQAPFVVTATGTQQNGFAGVGIGQDRQRRRDGDAERLPRHRHRIGARCACGGPTARPRRTRQW